MSLKVVSEKDKKKKEKYEGLVRKLNSIKICVLFHSEQKILLSWNFLITSLLGKKGFIVVLSCRYRVLKTKFIGILWRKKQ